MFGVRLAGEGGGVAGFFDDAQTVTQPLHGGTGDEDGAFERIGALAAQLIGDGGEQAVLGDDLFGACVEEREAARAVGRFHHARFKTGLAHGRGLLVACNTEDWKGGTE